MTTPSVLVPDQKELDTAVSNITRHSESLFHLGIYKDVAFLVSAVNQAMTATAQKARADDKPTRALTEGHMRGAIKTGGVKPSGSPPIPPPPRPVASHKPLTSDEGDVRELTAGDMVKFKLGFPTAKEETPPEYKNALRTMPDYNDEEFRNDKHREIIIMRWFAVNCDTVRAALSQQTPPGMVLVPIEPTRIMLDAFYEATVILKEGSVIGLEDGYKAMVLAAQTEKGE